MRYCLILSALCLTVMGCGNAEEKAKLEEIAKLWDRYNVLMLRSDLTSYGEEPKKRIVLCEAALVTLRQIEALDPRSIDPHTALADSESDYIRVDAAIRSTEMTLSLAQQNAEHAYQNSIRD